MAEDRLFSLLQYLLLATFRIVPLFMSSSMLPFMRFPGQVKAPLVVVAALLATSQTISVPDVQVYSLPVLLIGCFMEFSFGLLLVWGVQVVVAAIQTLGNVIDMQMGLGAAAIVDPKTQHSDTLIGSLLLMVTLLAMLEFNFHHDLLQVLFASFATVPVGREFTIVDLGIVVEGLSMQFFLGLILALPVLLSLLVLDLVIGFIAKTMPQANIYFVVLPLKILVGMMVLATTTPFLTRQLADIFLQARLTMSRFIGVG